MSNFYSMCNVGNYNSSWTKVDPNWPFCRMGLSFLVCCNSAAVAAPLYMSTGDTLNGLTGNTGFGGLPCCWLPWTLVAKGFGCWAEGCWPNDVAGGSLLIILVYCYKFVYFIYLFFNKLNFRFQITFSLKLKNKFYLNIKVALFKISLF